MYSTSTWSVLRHPCSYHNSIMAPSKFTRIVLNERPKTDIDAKTFRAEHVPYTFKPGTGEVVVQVTWISLDPAMRGWLRDTRSYLPPVQIGAVMRAGGLGVVVDVGANSQHKVGNVVYGQFGAFSFPLPCSRDIIASPD